MPRSELKYARMNPSNEATAVECPGEVALQHELTVVVINWNMPNMTIRCIRAVLDDGVPAARIVIVDNGSSDDSHERLQAELPLCQLVLIPENVGWARAANAGARVLAGSAYLFVNSDAFVHRHGTISALTREAGRESVGIVVPRILNEDLTLQPTVGPAYTPGVSLVLASGLSRFVPNRWQPSWSTHWDHSESRAIRSAGGVVMLVRSEVWESLGGFHESSTRGSEDIDLCWRARARGWRIWFTTDSEFVHLKSATTSRHWGEATRAEMDGRSEGAMIRRNLSPVASRLTLSVIEIGLVMRTTVFTALGRRSRAARARGSLRGYRART